MTRCCHIAPLLIMVLAMITSCDNDQKQGPVSSHIDSILFETGSLKQYTRLLELADSFEKSGNLTQLNAHRNGAAPNDDLTMMTLKVD